MTETLLTIEIPLDPDIAGIITWHGLFASLAVVAGVLVAAYYARRAGYSNDTIYNVALFLVIGGIIGARGLHVIEEWGRFNDDLVDIFRINTGGISIYGALIGGTVGALIYGVVAKVPRKWRGADIAALGAILGMGIGRIGDIINGEHWAEITSLPWAVRYTDADSPGRLHPLGPDVAAHPVVAYELLGDLAIFAVLLVILYKAKKDGLVFLSWVFLYGALRLGLSFLRLDDIVWAGLRTAQIIAVIAMAVSLPTMIYLLRTEPSGPTRAERRRISRKNA